MNEKISFLTYLKKTLLIYYNAIKSFFLKPMFIMFGICIVISIFLVCIIPSPFNEPIALLFIILSTIILIIHDQWLENNKTHPNDECDTP